MKKVFYVGILTLVLAGLTDLPSAQDAIRRQAPATLDDVLSELKGLRADLAISSSATIQTQLLSARLQVEQRRISDLSKRILDIEAQLVPTRLTIQSLQHDLGGFDDLQWMTSPNRDDIAEVIKQKRRGLAGQQQREKELVAQESNLAQQFAGEQSRLNDFNAQLDKLEESLTRK